MVKMISLGVCVVAMLGAQVAAAATGSVEARLNTASLTTSLQNSTVDLTPWTYRAMSYVDNGSTFGGADSPNANSDASVPGASGLTSTGFARSASSGGSSLAKVEMISTFTLGAGAHVTFTVPYSIILHTSQISDNGRGTLFFEVKNLANSGVAYNNTASFGNSDLSSPTPGRIDSMSGGMLVDFVNNTGATASYSFFGRVTTTLNVDATTAVPEADTYAMLLAGLAVLGGVACRRRPNAR